jgi:DNA-binding IclR family transcriptional regulator
LFVVKSAIRALELLEVLAERGTAMTHGALAEALSLPKSSLTELLAALESRQFVRRDDGGSRFGLGPEILPLAGALLRQMDIIKLTRPILAELMEKSGESAALSVRSGREIMVVARENGLHPVTYLMQVGHRAPLSTAAAGKALLGAASARDREAYLAEPLPAPTRHSVTDPEQLRAQLDVIATGGVAMGRDELFEGVVALAMPLRNAEGHPVAALSIGMPTMRFTPERSAMIEGLLRKAADQVSYWIGWRANNKTPEEQ